MAPKRSISSSHSNCLFLEKQLSLVTARNVDFNLALFRAERNTVTNRGYTLIELLITLVIVAVLVNMAAPSYAAFMDRSRTYSLALELKSRLVGARSEAIKYGTRTTLCASSDSQQCSGSFNQGWIVFRDLNNDGDIDTGEPIESVVSHNYPGTSVTALNTAGDSTNSIVFNFRGFTQSDVNFTVSRNSATKTINLSRAGRIVLE